MWNVNLLAYFFRFRICEVLGVFIDLNTIFIGRVLFGCRISLCSASVLVIRILCSFALSS
jgi:hypothetical protein